MELEFDHNYQHKVMQQRFAAPTELKNPADVTKWRSLWMSELKTWHSPYKALIDCSELSIVDDDEIRAALERMLKFFEGFFLRKAVGFSPKEIPGLPFEIFSTEEQARQAVGLREPKAKAEPGDLRSSIQIQNHFRQHAVEINFSTPITIDSLDKLAVFKSKLMNNLMQWHSKWNLIVDCSNLSFDPALHDEFDRLANFFRGLFLKNVVGYSPNSAKGQYPFPVYRARHKAVALLEAEGNVSGDEANCSSRQVVDE